MRRLIDMLVNLRMLLPVEMWKLGHFARNCRSKIHNGQQSHKNKRSGNYRQFHKPSSSNYEKSRYEGKYQQYNDQKMNNKKTENLQESVLCVDDAHKDNSESENEYTFSVSASTYYYEYKQCTY